MDVSIVIVSWNVEMLLKKCLESVIAHTSGVSYELIVVDNASTDGTHEMVRSFKSVVLIQNTKNKGFAAANNQGIAIAKGRHVLLLNPDTAYIENSIAQILEFTNTHERAGVIGCQLKNNDYSIQPSVRRFPRVVDLVVILLKLHKIFPSLSNRYMCASFNYEQPARVDQVMGAFFFITEQALKQAGGLEDRYFIWFEEVDYCRRVARAGFEIWYTPTTSVIHYGGQSFMQQTTIKKQWWFFRSALRYLRSGNA